MGGDGLGNLQGMSEPAKFAPDPFTGKRYRQFHRFFRADSRKILDVGCNTGRGGLADCYALGICGHLSEHHPRTLRRALLAIGFTGVRCYGSGRMSRYLGMRFPLLIMYGSYLLKAYKA